MKAEELEVLWKVKHGSQAYGMATPTSDLDMKGFGIPKDISYFFGFLNRFEQRETKDPDRNEECVIYDLRKFMKLASDANPSILDVLFVDEGDVLFRHPLADRVVAMRDSFLSKKVRHTYSGYAHSQLKRIRSHRSWLLDPPKGAPEREDFGIPANQSVVNSSELGAYNRIEAAGLQVSMPAEMIQLVEREKKYRAAHSHWKQYENWKSTRNPDRAAMEEAFGFDGKHASHLVRLIRMGTEILRGDGVIVRRPDAEELLSIRKGAWTYDQLEEWAESAEREMEAAYETSTLPKAPNRKALDALCVDILSEYFDCDARAIDCTRGSEVGSFPALP